MEGRIEDPETFPLVTEIATTQDFAPAERIQPLLRDLLEAYRRLRAESAAAFLLEKSHPNIWIAERLAAEFPTALFVGVYRSALPTVASMVRHGGVRGWYDRLPLDTANRFLGIDEASKDRFGALPLESKCTFRWVSHLRELQRLETVLGPRFCLVCYEDFVVDIEGPLRQIAELLRVPDQFERPRINESSIDRWKEELTEREVENINRVVADEGLQSFCR